MPKIKEKYTSKEKVTVLATQCLVCLEVIFLRTVFDNVTCTCGMTSFNNKGVSYINSHVANDGIIEEFDGPNIFRFVVPYTDNTLKNDERTHNNKLGHIEQTFPSLS